MAPYAFYPGWLASRRSANNKLSYPAQGRLSDGANRPTKSYSKRTSKQVGHANLLGFEKPSIDNSAKPSKNIAAAPSNNVVPSENITAVLSGDTVPSKDTAVVPSCDVVPSKNIAVVLSGDTVPSNGAAIVPSDNLLTVPQGPMANDDEASTRKAKPGDSKYTQPTWCSPSLTKTQKRRL